VLHMSTLLGLSLKLTASCYSFARSRCEFAMFWAATYVLFIAMLTFLHWVIRRSFYAVLLRACDGAGHILQSAW
jgi:hypothetical protein